MAALRPTRREFTIAALAGGGLVVSCTAGRSRTKDIHFAASHYFSIGRDNRLTVTSPRTEIGQGVMTGLAMLVAEELGADWGLVDVVHARADPALFGAEQNTVASQSLYDSWYSWREAAASARMMLERAAAARFRVDPADCQSAGSAVWHHATGRSLTFGQLATEAGGLPVPRKPLLKTRFDVVGRSLPRIDAVAKSTGAAKYGLDIQLDRMLTAIVLHPPRYGEAVEHVDAADALAQPGVEAVLAIPRRVITVAGRHFDQRGGVAVVARDYWTAHKASNLLKARWTRTRPTPSTAAMRQALVLGLGAQTVLAESGVRGKTAPILRRRYEAPFLAHATMEPMNCTARVSPNKCEVWAPSQAPLAAQAVAAAITGLPLSAVTVETPYVGGGFGRRTDVDYVTEAVFLAKSLGRPVKVAWPREEDMRQDYFRPMAVMELAGSVRGPRITAWSSKLSTGSSTAARRGGGDGDLVDWTSVLGADANPYAPEYFRSSYAVVELGPPTGYMRGVSNGYTCFANECFIDELAEAAGIDPVRFRLANLGHDARAAATVERAASLTRWFDPIPPDHGKGFALLRESRGNGPDDYNLCVATVVEVEPASPTAFKIRRATLVCDFGRIVNPNLVRAQMEGGVVFGLSAALKGRIDFVDGEPQQTNFDSYPVLRMDETPPTLVDLIESTARPGGVGEKGVPGIAPALANALYQASGRRARTLPLSLARTAAPQPQGTM